MVSTYSIKDIEKFSGINAHTIRMWEHRYGILNPDRNKVNYRRYNNEDLRRILKYCFSVSQRLQSF